jgi:hypothetical protein
VRLRALQSVPGTEDDAVPRESRDRSDQVVGGFAHLWRRERLRWYDEIRQRRQLPGAIGGDMRGEVEK